MRATGPIPNSVPIIGHKVLQGPMALCMLLYPLRKINMRIVAVFGGFIAYIYAYCHLEVL